MRTRKYDILNGHLEEYLSEMTAASTDFHFQMRPRLLLLPISHSVSKKVCLCTSRMNKIGCPLRSDLSKSIRCRGYFCFLCWRDKVDFGGEEEEAAKSQNFMVRRSQKVEQDPFDADGQQLNKK